MNYYNPYYQMYPYVAAAPVKKGIISSLTGGLKGMNWGTILNNTQRTLNIVNQAIPAVKQITPVMKNARTMFQVMNEFKKVDTPTPEVKPATTTTNTEKSNEVAKNNIESAELNQTVKNDAINEVSGPTFFI